VLAFGAAAASASTPLLPDLVADPPVGGNAPVVHSDAHGSRLLLRLDGFVHNRGPGPLEIRGADPVAGSMGTVLQRVYDDDDGFSEQPRTPAPELLYETNDDHEHWHLRHLMRYSLWSSDREVEVAPSQKAGFCLFDSEPVEAPADAAPVYTIDGERFCEEEQPSASSVFMGVSPGWRDVYSYVLAFQWVDISAVAPGRYWLRADVDPGNVIAETDEANPGAYDAEMTVVNGHRADPVAVGSVPALGTTTIELAATTYDDVHLGSPGGREFQIVDPPSGGTLDRPTGAWFTADAVRYSPDPGFHGPDSFTFAARDASSPFPREPPSAAVTLTVTGDSLSPNPGALGISNAPRSVYTSSRTQLSASGPGVEHGVTWAVDAIEGGSPRAGTITAGGLYRAPKSPPEGGSVTISARSATGATGAVSILVRRAPRARPAPTLRPPPVPRRGLSRIRLRLRERTLVAVVSSARTGRVRFSATSAGGRLGGCSMSVRRGGSATCSLRIHGRASRIVVRAALRAQGRTVATRRARLR
jgi:hypothetical protein